MKYILKSYRVIFLILGYSGDDSQSSQDPKTIKCMSSKHFKNQAFLFAIKKRLTLLNSGVLNTPA